MPIESPVAFTGTIAPTRLSLAYRLGLVVVAIAMLILPLLYLGLIGAAAWIVWLHLTRNTWMLGSGSGGQWRLLAYLTPAVAGVVLLFFMVKPLLARAAARPEPVPIAPDAEPTLFALIDGICRQVRAPRPQRVQMDCSVNASASFASGRLSLLRRDLVLTIGLPLVAGLSIRELAGVLAHEFGHFAQGGGMRLTVIVRGVNAWLGRVVYERDAWDVRLEHYSKHADWRLMIVLALARGSVWVSRKALAGLMFGGHAISCFMMRQIEYDADSYEIKIAGSAAFARTMVRLRELNYANLFAHGDVQEALGTGTLPLHMPAFIVGRSGRLPPELLATIRGDQSGKTRLFDTHPCDADRVRAAEAAAAAGALVGADAPATQLFRDFDALSAAATRHHFQHNLGIDVAAMAFVDTDTALRDSRLREEHFTAIQRLVGERWTAYRPFRIPFRHVQFLGAAALRTQLLAAQASMTAEASQTTALYSRFDALDLRRHKAFAARELLSAGFNAVKPEDFDLTEGTLAAASAADEEAIAQEHALTPQLDAFETHAAKRLACGLVLSAAAAQPGASDPSIDAMVDALNALAGVMPDVRELRNLDTSATLIKLNVSSSQRPQVTTEYLGQVERRMAGRRDNIRAALAPVPCPPDLAASAMTLAERCGLSPDGPFVEASDVVARTIRLYTEALGRLAAMALDVEDRLVV